MFFLVGKCWELHAAVVHYHLGNILIWVMVGNIAVIYNWETVYNFYHLGNIYIKYNPLGNILMGLIKNENIGI